MEPSNIELYCTQCEKLYIVKKEDLSLMTAFHQKALLYKNGKYYFEERDGLSNIVTFDTKESAKNAAETQLSFMENSFCGKHNFDITEVDDHYVIGMLGGCGCGSHHKY